MGSLIAIDPGKWSAGFAVFLGERLASCGYVNAKTFPEFLAKFRAKADRGYFSEVVIEIPQVYQRRQSRGDPNDLIPLAITAGGIASVLPCPDLSFVFPREWKGSVRKELHQPRILKRLHPEELEVLDRTKLEIPISKIHNAIDAVGIGLWKLRR